MIITLTKADFSALNVGTLSTWHVFKSLDRGVTYEGVNSVNKDETFIATLTVAEGYELVTDGVVITMGGQTLDSNALAINGNIITISIAKVTGNISIRVPTTAILPEVPEPDVPVTPTPDPEEPEGGDTPDTDIVINYALKTQINDNTGALEGSGSKPRAATTSVLKVNEGDSITVADDANIEFIAYAWADDAGKSYLGYIDCDPNNAYNLGNNNNWSRGSFTFQTTTKGSKSSGNFSYPVYIRLVFRPTDSAQPTIETLTSNMTYNITGYMDNFAGSTRLTDATVDGINYKIDYRYDDSNGALMVNDQGYDSRAVWTTPVKVSAGDNIKLNNSGIKFLLYAYSNTDEPGKDSNYLGYIDTDTSSDSGNLANWGQDFTFAADTVASKSSSPVSYPIYVRGVFRDASGNAVPISLTDIVENMKFNIADTTE